MTTKDGTQTQADVTTSSGNGGTSQGATYTEAQLQEMVRKTRSDALAEVGRIRAQSEASLKAAQDAQRRLTQMEAERIQSELDAHKDNPAEIKRIRAEQKAREAEEARAKAEQELNEAREKTKQWEAQQAESTRTQSVAQMATRYGVDTATLTSLAKLTDGSADAVEILAKSLPKAQQKNNSNLIPDSNRGSGGADEWPAVLAEWMKSGPNNPDNARKYLGMKAQHSKW